MPIRIFIGAGDSLRALQPDPETPSAAAAAINAMARR
jgi:hypothetical protein